VVLMMTRIWCRLNVVSVESSLPHQTPNPTHPTSSDAAMFLRSMKTATTLLFISPLVRTWSLSLSK
jgi:hypothetical protein